MSANILSTEEYLRIRDALGWGVPFPTRDQKMAICALMLAYRCGLRRKEIMGLRLQDVEGEGQLDVLVRPHRGRRTKSSSAERPLPQDLLATPEEEGFLRDWTDERSREPGTAPASYLFTANPLASEMIADSQLFGMLRSLIKQVSGDGYAVLHHLRHSFETNLVTRLLRREDIPLNSVPAFFKISAEDDLHPVLKKAIEGNEVSGRKKLRATAIMIGHQDVETGIFSYFHLCDFLLGYYCRHESAAPRFTSKALARVLDVSEKRSQQLRKEKGHPLLHALEVFARGFQHDLEHPLMQEASLPAEIVAPTRREGLPPFDAVYANMRQVSEHAGAGRQMFQEKAEYNWVKKRYEMIRGLQVRSQRRLVNTALRLEKCLRRESLEFSQFDQARDFLRFLNDSCAGLGGLLFSIHGSRWSSEKQQDKGVERWKNNFPELDFSRGRPCQGKSPSGCRLRVASVEKGGRLEYIFTLLETLRRSRPL